MASLAPSIAAVSLGFGILASSASADILIANSNAFAVDLVPGSSVSVPIEKGGDNVLKFSTTKKGVVVITFNAECAVAGDVGTWLFVKILVDGKPTEPKSGTDFALCSAVGTTEIYFGAVRQSFVTLKEGDHTVEVVAGLSSGADTGRIDDLSIVVSD